jgi:hypothetical protein
MGLTAGVSSSAAGASSAATSLLSPVGLGVGGVFIAALLIFFLAYYDMISASEQNYENVQTMLSVAIAPLVVTFGAVVVFQSLQILGYLG